MITSWFQRQAYVQLPNLGANLEKQVKENGPLSEQVSDIA